MNKGNIVWITSLYSYKSISKQWINNTGMELLLKVKKSYGTIHKRRRQIFWIFDIPLPHVGSSIVLSVGNFDQFLTPPNCRRCLWTTSMLKTVNTNERWVAKLNRFYHQNTKKQISNCILRIGIISVRHLKFSMGTFWIWFDFFNPLNWIKRFYYQHFMQTLILNVLFFKKCTQFLKAQP